MFFITNILQGGVILFVEKGEFHISAGPWDIYMFVVDMVYEDQSPVT